MTSAPAHNRRLFLGVLVIVLLTFAVYLPILPGNFLMDDARLVGHDNPLVNGQLTPASLWFQTDFTLATFGWWLEHLTFGPNPAGYHVVNILLHALSALLLWRLLVRLKIPGAWLAGALFAVHPVCVNSVARIAELKNTLSLPFFLLSFLAYLRYEAAALHPAEGTQPPSNKATAWLVVSLAAFVLSLLAKTPAVMLPVVLLLYALWQRRRIGCKDVVHTLPFFVLTLAFGLMSVWFQKHQALTTTQLVLQPAGFAQRVAGAGYDFWFYLGKALFPFHLSLQYPGWTIDTHSALAYVPVLLAWAVPVVCAVFWRSWGRHVFFGLASFAVILFPSLGFFDAQFLTMWQVSDHLQYAALPALIALVAAGLAMIPLKSAFPHVTVALLLGLSILAFNRAEAFKSQDDLMADTVAKNPLAAGAHNDLGISLATKGDYGQAGQEFQTAVQCDPNNADARVDLGHFLMMEGKFSEAEMQFVAALKIEPYDPPAHETYAHLLEKEGRNAEAFYHLQTAALFQPDFATCMEAASLAHQLGRPRQAVSLFRQALSFKMDAGALNDLAWILATCPDDSVRNGSEAVRDAEEACRLTSFTQAAMAGTLAAAYAEAGRFPEAIQTAEQALALATAAGDTTFAGEIQQLLVLYRSGKPYRENR